MKILITRLAAIIISIFFIVSIATSSTLIPAANAHTPAWNITDHAYISLAPNPSRYWPNGNNQHMDSPTSA